MAPIDQFLSLQDQIARCELELQASRAYIKALEYGLHAVIASHPAPAALTELWSHLLAEVADAHAGGATPSPLFDAAFQQAMAGLTEHIEGAADRQPGATEKS